MINGAHIVVESTDAEADHVFFTNILKFPAVDAGGGYLIFALPPSEMSLHGSPNIGRHHELYLLTEDVDSFSKNMRAEGVACSEIQTQSWGAMVEITLPSGASLHVYQPRHARP